MRRAALGTALLLTVFAASCQTQVAGGGSYGGSASAGATSSGAAPSSGGVPSSGGTPSSGGAPSGSGVPSGFPLPTSGLPPVPSGPTLPTFPASFVGTWRGLMAQPNSTLPTWTAVLTMPAGAYQGAFEVSGHCKGILTLLSVGATSVLAVERITSDPGDVCANVGGITLTPAGGGMLRCEWFDYSDDKNVARGTLTKG
jgi:hypothetical protein